jgi:hypothetical protein
MYIRTLSELFHVGEVLGVLDALDDPVPVLDVLRVYVHSRVENVLQAVLPQVLHR